MKTLILDDSELFVLQTIATLRHECGFPSNFNAKIVERSGLTKKEFRELLNGVEGKINALSCDATATIDWTKVY